MGKVKCVSCEKWVVSTQIVKGRPGTLWQTRKICTRCDNPKNRPVCVFEEPENMQIDNSEPDPDSPAMHEAVPHCSTNIVPQAYQSFLYQSSVSDSSMSQISLNIGSQFSLSIGSQFSIQSSAPSMSSVSSTSTQANVSTVFLPSIPTIATTERCCFICKRTDQRCVVPDSAVRQSWRVKNVFLSKTTRCCRFHLRGDLFSDETLARIEVTKTGIYMDPPDICRWILELTNTHNDKPRIDFADPEDLTTEDVSTLLPCSRAAFNEMYTIIRPRMRSSSNRHVMNPLAMMLMMLRLNLTQRFLAFLFRTEQRVVSQAIQSVSDLLLDLYVPQHLGYGHLSRERAIAEHSHGLFNELFAKHESLFLIVDATYIDIEKPGDFEEQRKSYCLPKKKNLFKPTLFVLPSGYILEVSDLCYSDAKNNDATILKYLFETSELTNYIEEGDVLIVDRGYRDSVGRAQESGLDVYMPHLLQGHGTRRIQFTSQEANESRKVTSCRWVVEAKNGQFKNVFKFFAGKVEASYKASLNKFVKIGCAILNHDHPKIFDTTPNHHNIAQRMLARMDMANLLQSRIDDNGWNTPTRSRTWNRANQATFEDFPRLTLDDLTELTNGAYQIRMAQRYTAQHMEQNGDYEIWVHEEAPTLVRGTLHSRFSKTEKHNVWVEYSSDREGISNILGYYCTCKSGARTAGTCSHVTSVVRYLGYDRHQPLRDNVRRKRPAMIVDAAAELERIGIGRR